MKLVVISPEHDDPRETVVLGALFAAGLERYHVRKPHWPAARLEAWLHALPEDWRTRLVLHQHHELVAKFGLGGRHWRDEEGGARCPQRAESVLGTSRSTFTSRSCHELAALRAALGQYDAVFLGPVFPSISKPGHGPCDNFSPAEISSLLNSRTVNERRTAVLALGGVTAARLAQIRALGFDGVAVLGAVWQADDPVAAFCELITACAGGARCPQRAAARPTFNLTMPLDPTHFPVMCITQDGLPLTPAAQAARLCAAGARWIQLRMKNAAPDKWLATAREVVAICHAHGALCVVNDNVDIALAAGADGVHLGKLDPDWREVRSRLGPLCLIGGTVNNVDDADHALAAGCLDYVGVGPLRFTTTKQKLAPILGLDGVIACIVRLDGLPAWVVGGVEATDLPALRAVGAAGAAVSGALFRQDKIEGNYGAFAAAWDMPQTRVSLN